MKNKRPPCWNSTSGFDFDPITIIGIHSASEYQLLSKPDHPRLSSGVILIFKMATAAAQFYFLFRIGWG